MDIDVVGSDRRYCGNGGGALGLSSALGIGDYWGAGAGWISGAAAVLLYWILAKKYDW